MILIGISGKKQSGKDTVAGFIKEIIKHESYTKLNFADALKREVSQATGIALAGIEAMKSEFRPVLQWWGTDFRRKMQQEDYWIRQWEIEYLKYRNEGVDLLICTDVRFENEADIIKSYGGKLIRINIYEDYKDKHSSETGLDEYEWFDDNIFNYKVSLDDLKDRVIQSLYTLDIITESHST